MARAVVAVPVRDEADRIGACLAALTVGQSVPPAAVVLVINNTTDATEPVVRALLPSLSVPVAVVVHEFAPGQACAGAARRLAMDYAAEQMDATVLLTTDADSQVPADWIAANLRHIGAGADAVAGRAVMNEADAVAIPDRLRADDALECAYAACLDAIAAAVDPDPFDPLPRHTEHSGASIAVRRDAYRRAGGMPASPLGEDRDFFRALRRVDARIRHAADIAVIVSGRIMGRAEGGMADTIRRRLSARDPFLDPALEPAGALLRRVSLRRAVRGAWRARRFGAGPGAALPERLGLPVQTVAAALAERYAGAAWDAIERASPILARAAVPAASAAAELDHARQILATLAAAESTILRA